MLKKAIVKVLPGVKKVEFPTYTKDITGSIEPWD